MDMKSFLRLSVAMLCSVIAVPGFAAFGVASVTDLGLKSGSFTVNQLVTGPGSSVLKTSATTPAVDANDSNTFATGVSGHFKVFLLALNANVDGTFEWTFANRIVALVASNSLSGGGKQLTLDVAAAFETQAGIAANLGGNNSRALEILDFNLNNPDAVTVSGKTVSGDVSIGPSPQSGPEAFYVLTAVPEPASVAIWGACGIGAVVAGRRRLRKQNA
jgi:hypothetical protein